jgi:hypothetical protein
MNSPVNEIADNTLAAGATLSAEPTDHGFTNVNGRFQSPCFCIELYGTKVAPVIRKHIEKK